MTAPVLTGITIGGSDTVAEFASVNLTATLSPNGAVGQVVWASDDPSVATVDGRGRVTGVAAGKVTIRASVTNPDGTSVAAEYEVTVTKSRSTHSAEFYYLKSPDSDPASNGTNNWGKTIGNGSIDVTNAEWNGINCFVSSQQNRIVEWPSGFDNGVVPRTSPHWNVIFDAFKSTVGSDVAEDDIESITLVPYKISKNDAYHVDCQVVVKAKQAATATFYLWDVEDTGYIFKYAETVRKGKDVDVPGVVRNLPSQKIVSERTYRLVAWRTNPGLSGNEAQFPFTMQENTNFYAKYVAEYLVKYDLAGGSWKADSQNAYAAGDTVAVTSERPQKTGYEFKGWKLSTDGADIASGDTFIMPAQDVTLTAQWEKRADLSYTINYYRDSIAEENRIDEAVVVDEQTFGDTVTLNQATIDFKRPAGYRAGIADPQSLVIKVEGNVFNVVYEKRTDLSYTVNYLEQGTGKVLHEAKTVDGQTFGAEVTESAIDIAGYNKVEPASTSITIGASGNEISFYYAKRTDLSYTVNYFEGVQTITGWVAKEDENGQPVTVHESETVNNVTYEDIVMRQAVEVSGYELKSESPQTITIGASGNVINFYYAKRTDLSYTVSYVDEDGNALADAKTVGDKTFGDTVTEDAIDIAGWALDSVVADEFSVEGKTGSIVVGADSAKNEIKFVYSKDETGTDDPEKGDGVPDKYQVTFTYVAAEGGSVSGAVKEVVTRLDEEGNYSADAPVSPRADVSAAPEEGYWFVDWSDGRGSFQNEAILQQMKFAGDTEFTASFMRQNNLSYTVNYLEQGTNAVLATAKTVGNRTFGDTVTEDAIDIAGYELAAGEQASKSIEIAAEGNAITFTYAKRAFGLVYTYEGAVPAGAQQWLNENAPEQDVLFGEDMSVLDEPEIDGYTFSGWIPQGVEVANGSFTMPANDVTFVGSWTADGDTRYTVNYYQQNIDDDDYTLYNSEERTAETATQVNAIAAEREGFTFNATRSVTTGTVAGDGSLVLNIYYDRNAYTVTYTYGGTVPAGAPALPATQTYRYGQTVTIAPNAALAGYTFSGWGVTGTMTMGGSNIVLTGSFTAVTTVVPTPTPVVPTAPVVTPAAVTPATPTPAAPAAPATPAPATPAPAAAPAAATPAPAAEPIEDDATPQAAAPTERTPLAETEEIEGEASPMGAFDEPHCWVHWVMLLGILITAAYGAIVVRRRLHLADDVDDYEKQVLGIEDEVPEAVPADGRQAL